jgi:hypothetical protein
VPGRGFGAQRMANPAVLQAAQCLTDLILVPGTLNVRLPQPFDGPLPWYCTEADLGGNVWRDHAPNRIGIRCGAVRIAGRYHGSVFQGDEPEYPPAQVEIMSDGFVANFAQEVVKGQWSRSMGGIRRPAHRTVRPQ